MPGAAPTPTCCAIRCRRRGATRVDVALYLKDESTHITGSLKHRLARSLFLYGLCNGWITEGTTVVEASSGSTAVSEAYFAALLGLPFVAVMPASTSRAKVALIEKYGGRCHFVRTPADVNAEAQRIAERDRRAFPGPVHQRRTRHRLARQQQHRRVDLRPDARRTPPDPVLDRGGRRHRRHQRHHRPLHPLPAATAPGCAWSTRRTPPSSPPTPRAGATSPPGRRRASRASAGRGSSRRSCPPSSTGWCGCPTPPRWRRPIRCQQVLGTAGGPVDRDQPVGRVRPAGRDGGRRRQRIGGHLDLRQRRPLRRHLLRRRLAGRPRPRTGRATPTCLREFERDCSWPATPMRRSPTTAAERVWLPRVRGAIG